MEKLTWTRLSNSTTPTPTIEKEQSKVEDNNFKVGTYSLYKKGDKNYCHWSEGLKMVIEKDGVTMTLEGDEIQKIVESLPRTIGGVL